MKRCVQILMMTVALVAGAQTAQAATIYVAQFSWEELCSDPDPVNPAACEFGLTNLFVSNLSNGQIENLVVTPAPFEDPEMTPFPLVQLPGDLSYNFHSFIPGTLMSVLVEFDYVFAGGTLTISNTYLASGLDSTDPTSPYRQQGEVFSREVIAEPASLSLLAIGLAAAVRRRRH